jgi:hypothetical protein
VRNSGLRVRLYTGRQALPHGRIGRESAISRFRIGFHWLIFPKDRRSRNREFSTAIPGRFGDQASNRAAISLIAQYKTVI